MKILFSAFPDAEYQGVALTSAGADHRLLSYAFLRHLPCGFLEEYVKTGVVVDDETDALALFLAPRGTRPR